MDMDLDKHFSSRNYKLNEQGEPVPCSGLMDWAMWFESSENQRIVARDEIGDVRVSTIFLGLDHNWRLEGPPILWETMTFGGGIEQECERCAGSREQALAMHATVLAHVREALRKP